jgi:endonuclease/exonuclease/phosphatase family metal-dependent hydrolase
MKKSYKIVIAILFFMPLISAFIMYGISESPIEAPTKSQFKFMTYNIHFGQGMDDKINLERLAQNILTDKPDILGLQEVDNGRITTQGIDMARWLANRLHMHYYYFPAENEQTVGCALLSRYPITFTQSFMIPSIDIQRILIHGTVKINSSLNLDVTHLGLINRSEDMNAQVNFILSKTNAVVNAHKILMGDFNLENNTAQIQTIRTFFNDTMDKFESNPITFPSINLYDVPEESIDYIFATGYTDIINSYVIRDFNPNLNNDPVEFGSDHLPVVTILTF